MWSEAGGVARSAARGKTLAFDSLSNGAGTNAALAHASNEAESEAAHRAAAWYAAQLLTRYGRAQVLEWLRSGLPAGVVATLGQR